MLNWKIYYSDKTYSNEDGSPELAPKTDVQVIVQNHDVVGHSVEYTTDFYIWLDYWRGVDHFGLWDYLAQPGKKIVLFGRYIGNEAFKDILNRAQNDPEVPRKSAWLPNKVERRS